MGLSMPRRGVQAPTFGYEFDSFQVQVLDELGWNTVSPYNADNTVLLALLLPVRKQGWESTPLISRGMSLCF